MSVKRRTATRAAACGLGLMLATGGAKALLAQQSTDWPMFGQNVANTAFSASETAITTKHIGKMGVKWTFTTGGDVSARAAVVSGVVYFPDWAGNLFAVNRYTGQKVWSHQLSDYGLPAGTVSRTTPAVVSGTLFLGTQAGAWLLAINAANGNLLWKTQLESADPFALISTSPAVHNGVVYTGVASLAEGGTVYGANIAAAGPRGSAVAVNAATGAIMWKTYMVPPGYYGGGVWGSNPAVDPGRNTVFVSTGNNYIHPTDPAYVACIGAGGTAASCNAPNDYVDSVVALDMTTGAVKWARSLVTWGQGGYGVLDGSDDWNVDCIIFGPPAPGSPSQCPSSAGPDYDFASAPNLITYQTPSGPKTIVGAGQKSGIYYALNPDTGGVLWQTQVGPGSTLGGMEWGSASDGQRIYVQITNLFGIGPVGNSAGSWSALNPATGAIIWQKPDPNGAMALGPVTVANGIVYVGSMAGAATAKTMLGLDAATGQTLWSFAAGSSVNAGASISDGVVFWGAGYTHLGFPGMTGNNKFYAFSKNGQ